MSAFPPSAAMVSAVEEDGLCVGGKGLELLERRLYPRNGACFPMLCYRLILATTNVVNYDNIGQGIRVAPLLSSCAKTVSESHLFQRPELLF